MLVITSSPVSPLLSCTLHRLSPPRRQSHCQGGKSLLRSLRLKPTAISRRIAEVTFFGKVGEGSQWQQTKICLPNFSRKTTAPSKHSSCSVDTLIPLTLPSGESQCVLNERASSTSLPPALAEQHCTKAWDTLNSLPSTWACGVLAEKQQQLFC